MNPETCHPGYRVEIHVIPGFKFDRHSQRVADGYPEKC